MGQKVFGTPYRGPKELQATPLIVGINMFYSRMKICKSVISTRPIQLTLRKVDVQTKMSPRSAKLESIVLSKD